MTMANDKKRKIVLDEAHLLSRSSSQASLTGRLYKATAQDNSNTEVSVEFVDNCRFNLYQQAINALVLEHGQQDYSDIELNVNE